MKADFGRTADDYRKFRAGFPQSFFEVLKDQGIIAGSECVVDLGTGTGTLARGVARLGCHVIGIDPSAEMLIQARKLAESDGVDVAWKQASAEETGLEDASVDIVAAGQCWHWFDAGKAMRETRRILRKNGLLVIAHFDWLAFSGNVVQQTEELIHQVNPKWTAGGGVGIHPEWFRHLSEGGFQEIRSLSYDENVSYTHEAWRGRIRASAGIGASLSQEAVEAFDRRHAEMLARDFPDDPLVIPHRVFIIQGRFTGDQES